MSKSSNRRRITATQVARLARVHLSIASRVLRHQPVRVLDQTRERILAAARDLGWTDFRGATVSHGEATVILAGRFDLGWEDTIYAELPDDLGRSADDAGMDLAMLEIDAPAGLEAHQLATLGCGLILHESVADQLPSNLGTTIPTVLFNWPVDSTEADIVLADEAAGMHELGAMLRHRGHRRIAWVMAPHTRRGRSGRIQGAILAELFPGCLNLIDDPQAIRHALTGPRPPTAIVTCSSEVELPVVLRVAADLALRIPGDLSLAVADRTPYCTLVRPDITSIETPIHRMCALTVQTLIERSNQPDRRAVRHLVPGRLIPGGTCGSIG